MLIMSTVTPHSAHTHCGVVNSFKAGTTAEDIICQRYLQRMYEAGIGYCLFK